MAVNAFLSFFDKVDGESIQKGKEKWIEIQGWDWEVEAETSWTKGGGASVGKPNPGKMTVEHYFDTASTVILGFICTGKAFPKAEIQMMKTTGKGSPETYLTITMEGVFLTKVSQSGTEEGNVRAEARIRLQDRQDRIQAAKHQGRLARCRPDLQLGHPGGHGISVGLTPCRHRTTDAARSNATNGRWRCTAAGSSTKRLRSTARCSPASRRTSVRCICWA